MDEGPLWCKACRSVGMVHCAHPDECGAMLNGKDAWLSWIDDLPLPDDFQPAQDSLQEYISTLTAERDAAFALGLEAVAKLAMFEYRSRLDRQITSGSLTGIGMMHGQVAEAMLTLAKQASALAPVTPLKAALALPEVRELVGAAYAQGAMDVHNNYEECRSPDFSEAARDYAAAALAKLEAKG